MHHNVTENWNRFDKWSKSQRKKKIQNYVKKEGKYISGLDYFHKKKQTWNKKKNN